MPEEIQQQDAYPEIVSRLRDLEEKIRLLKDRLLLVGNSLVEARERSFAESQEIKKSLFALQEENIRTKEIIQRIAEQLSLSVRKEELFILQRQFDLFRESPKS